MGDEPSRVNAMTIGHTTEDVLEEPPAEASHSSESGVVRHRAPGLRQLTSMRPRSRRLSGLPPRSLSAKTWRALNVHPRGVLRRHRQWSIAGTADCYRRERLLKWLGIAGSVVDGVMMAAIVRYWLGPQKLHDFERSVEAFVALSSVTGSRYAPPAIRTPMCTRRVSSAIADSVVGVSKHEPARFPDARR